MASHFWIWDFVGTRLLTVTVVDDEIATPAADNADLPIGRLTLSAARFEGLSRWRPSVDSLQRGYFLLRMWSVNRRQGCLPRGEGIGRVRPMGTPAGIVTGRVLRDAWARTPPVACGVVVRGSACAHHPHAMNSRTHVRRQVSAR